MLDESNLDVELAHKFNEIITRCMQMNEEEKIRILGKLMGRNLVCMFLKLCVKIFLFDADYFPPSFIFALDQVVSILLFFTARAVSLICVFPTFHISF